MKAKELRNKTIEELKKLRDELRKKLVQLFLEKKLGRLTKPHLIKMTKKDLARVITVIKEKENSQK